MRGVAAHFCAAVLLITAVVSATDEVSVRTLLISNTLNITNTHSRFIKYLEASGRELDIREASDANLRLRDWDIWLYDELIIFAPQADGAPSHQQLDHSVRFGYTLHASSTRNASD